MVQNKDRLCVEQGECRPRHKSSKDVRAWCKGVRGREHRWTWMAEDVWQSHQLYGEPMVISRRERSRLVREIVACAVCFRKENVSRRRCGHCGEVVSDYGELPAFIRRAVSDPSLGQRSEKPASVGAVDPSASSTGTPTTREKEK